MIIIMPYTLASLQSLDRAEVGGNALSYMVVVVACIDTIRRQTLAPLQWQNGACQAFTDQADIACTKKTTTSKVSATFSVVVIPGAQQG